MIGSKYEVIKYVVDSDSEDVFEVIRVTKKRSTLLNRALHLYFKMIAIAYNETGLTYEVHGYECPFTMELVKNAIFKPILFSLYGVDSTTKLDSKQVNTIIDIITLHISAHGITVHFPSNESMYLDWLVKNGSVY